LVLDPFPFLDEDVTMSIGHDWPTIQIGSGD
jgi:hypothetical protein